MGIRKTPGKYKQFTQEQLDRANGIDLADMLLRKGEPLKKQGKVYRWMRYDSTVIYNNKWFRHSRQVGGGPIQFIQHFYNMGFVDAVNYLLGGENGAHFVQADKAEYVKPEFQPPKFASNMHRTFAYLIKTRKIDADIVQYFVKEKKIKETQKYHNVAFCGYDENGELKQVHLRATQSNRRFFLDVDGSDKRYFFRHMGTDHELYVFEAPIDMLSYICLNKENWQQHSYVCLGGVAADALRNAYAANENIMKVFLCVDNDERGDEVEERIGKELTENGVPWERILPQGKDWNDDLVAVKELAEMPNFEMKM